MGIFAEACGEYLSHGVAVFPVDAEKKRPSIKGPNKVGLKASRELVTKFPEADAFGFLAGQKSRITVLDVDVPGSEGERKLTELMGLYGVSPLIVQTASGNYHAYYRHAGEGRWIRVNDEAVDILGSGMVIAPPSRVASGSYQVIEGTLADLDDLPTMHVQAERDRSDAPESVREGERNNSLWRHCMRSARSCDSLDALMGVALAFNRELAVPLPDEEVASVANSAWEYTVKGSSHFGKGEVVRITRDEMMLLGPGSEAVNLLTFLRMRNGSTANFMIANGLRQHLGWSLKRIRSARKNLITARMVEQSSAPSSETGAALYRWSKPGKGGQL